MRSYRLFLPRVCTGLCLLAVPTQEGVAHWIAAILTGFGIDIVAVPQRCWAQRISRSSDPVVSKVLHMKCVELRCCKILLCWEPATARLQPN